MRNYKKEYTNYQSTPEQIKKRSMRNKARRLMEKKYGKSRLKGKDIDHRKGVEAGNSASNLRIMSVHDNRSFPRTKNAGVKRRRK